MALKWKPELTCEHCGQRKSASFYDDDSLRSLGHSCSVVPGPPNPPRTYQQGEFYYSDDERQVFIQRT